MLASFYGTGDELNLAFNFLLLHSRFEADAMRKVVEDTVAAIPPESWPVWTGGNHDMYRFPSRWAEGDPAKTRCALMMLLTLPGSVFLYYGDELGMLDTDVPKERLEDPVGRRLYPVYGRDPERTPMPWSPRPGAGFTAPNVEPWLPFGDIAACNVEDQRRDPDRCSRCAATSSLCGPPFPTYAPAVTRESPPRAGCGRGGAASG